MVKKKTLVCIHVMPHEIEMLERFMMQYHRTLRYLDEDDDVTLKVTLNLNPELTDWENSELKQAYFVSRFGVLFNGIKNINEIILDTSCWGTTQQKRESIKLSYDQFIFCDADIALHEHLLKHQLNISYQLSGIYILSPSIPRWWDDSWDVIVDSSLKDKPLGYAHSEEALKNAYLQKVEKIHATQIPALKFGCGMHTLYSKSFWELVGIPESFGGYGPEDTYGMLAGAVSTRFGHNVQQFVLDGCYITEDYINNKPSFGDKVKRIDKKREFYDNANSLKEKELINFIKKLEENKSNS
jgi:hypothetical protein